MPFKFSFSTDWKSPPDWELIYKEMSSYIKRKSRSMLGSDQFSCVRSQGDSYITTFQDDILQEVVFSFYKNYLRQRPIKKIYGYISAVIRNTATKENKHLSRFISDESIDRE